MNAQQAALAYRRNNRGIIGVASKVAVRDGGMLALVYTPGVAESCTVINKDPEQSFVHTWRANAVAMLTDGSNIPGLGNVGPEAAVPLMESKAALFKTLAGVDAFPCGLAARDVDQIIKAGILVEPTFGAVFVDGIATPKCIEIVDRLQESIQVPVYHESSHSVPVAVLAGLINALRVVGKDLANAKIVINGAGAAGSATAILIAAAGAKNVILCDTVGAIYEGRTEHMTPLKQEVAENTNHAKAKGPLAEVLKGADVFIGLSGGNAVSEAMVATMAKDAIVFALASPVPEIAPELAKKAGAKVVATANADTGFPQIYSALVFPGFLRGLLDTRAQRVTTVMLMRAAQALADICPKRGYNVERLLPDVLDASVAPIIAEAVARTAEADDLARVHRAPGEVARKTETYIWTGRFPMPPYPTAEQEGTTPKERALNLRIRHTGVLQIKNKVKTRDARIMSTLLLPPYDTEAAKAVVEDKLASFYYTARSNLVAVVTDGTAVLGLGDIGGGAGLPVMEGKAILFNTLAGVEAFPICLATKDPDEIVEVVKMLAPSFGGVNLEDISAPRCFEIENRLKKETNIPIFHDDQHGTAIVVLSAMINGLRLTGGKLSDLKVVMNGAGAAGVAVCKLLISAGLRNVILCDRNGPIYEGRKVGMNWIKEEMARITNPEKIKGTLADALKGADVFIGVSAPGQVTQEMVCSMHKNPMIMAMANPTPEIMPDEAKAAGAAIVATGRSDFKNQVNNCLAFPGLFRGALDVRARDINEEMKVAAAYAIANFVTDKDLSADYIIPAAMDLRVQPKVAAAVAKAAIDSGVAQTIVDPAVIEANTRGYLYEEFLGPLPE